MASSPQFISSPNTKGTSFANSDGTTAKTIFTPGSNGSRVHAISIVSTDTSARDITLAIVQSSVAYIIARFTLAAASTITITNGLDNYLMPWILSSDPYLILQNGTTLQANMEATITSGKKVDIAVFGGDF